MGTFGQQYMLPLAQVGQDRVLRADSSRFNNDITGTGNALNLGVGGSALALQALQPAVLNNLQYAPEYMDAVNTYSDFASGVDMYNKLQMGVNMTNPKDGNAYFSEAFGLGNTFETGALLGLSAINPAVGISMLTNALTTNDDNPFGQIPLVSDVQEGISNFSDWLNSTQVGGNITSGLSGLYDNVFKPVTNSVPGKYANAIAQLPLDFTDAVVSTLGEGYEFIDGTLFGGYLPGGQTDDPESQEWNNPLENLENRLNDMSSLYKTQDRLDAEVAYDKFTPLQQNLVNDMVANGTPYQLAVNAIYQPELLAGYSDLWVTDYGRKVAEIEYGPETIERFKEYARDPENNPILMADKFIEGSRKLSDDVIIDPTTGLLKPINTDEDSIVGINQALRDASPEIKALLGDNYLSPEVIDVYAGVESATIDGAERFVQNQVDSDYTSTKEKFNEFYGDDQNTEYWLNEFAYDANTGKTDYQLIDQTLDYMNEGVENLGEKFGEARSDHMYDISLQAARQYDELGGKRGIINDAVEKYGPDLGDEAYSDWEKDLYKGNGPWTPYGDRTSWSRAVQFYHPNGRTEDGHVISDYEPFSLTWALTQRGVGRGPNIWKLYKDPSKAKYYGWHSSEWEMQRNLAHPGGIREPLLKSDHKDIFIGNAEYYVRKDLQEKVPTGKDYVDNVIAEMEEKIISVDDYKSDSKQKIIDGNTGIKVAKSISDLSSATGLSVDQLKQTGLSFETITSSEGMKKWANDLATGLVAQQMGDVLSKEGWEIVDWYKEDYETYSDIAETMKFNEDFSDITLNPVTKYITETMRDIGLASAGEGAGLFLETDFNNAYDDLLEGFSGVGDYDTENLMKEYEGTQFDPSALQDFNTSFTSFYPETIDLGGFTSEYNAFADTYSIPTTNISDLSVGGYVPTSYDFGFNIPSIDTKYGGIVEPTFGFDIINPTSAGSYSYD